MLGDEAMKECKVPDSFLVPENCPLEDNGEESQTF